jgi:predicted RNase H-like HicB family nuclease
MLQAKRSDGGNSTAQATMMATKALTVKALWDDEAGVWVAASEDVPGLATEAPTIERLVAKLQVMIPELLELNAPGGPADAELTFRVKAERTARIAVRAA